MTFLALYIAAISLGNLLCGLVDYWLRDAATEQNTYSTRYQADSLRWLIASLLVSFPVWFALTRAQLIGYARDPAQRTSPARMWLTYMTLAVAVAVVLITLIVLVAAALGGEGVDQTLIKSAIVISIAGSVFGFYFWGLRREERSVGP